MSILKCKMCGGELQFEEGMTVCECEYCGTKQTIPVLNDEKMARLYTRANRLRMASEFDKAYSIYESIVAEDDQVAEAYWGLILCKYGIEYVDDPATGKKIPTCHRSSFESVMEDPNFEMVMENADAVARSVYRDEAKAIEELRKGILEVSGKEEPYDIFICYKETAENGERTLDSVLAQDVYDHLTAKGYRVFFSRISLEDKLGVEYEPYIFAALNSAKVMLAFGTSYDYYNAVWVKNEWSRFLKLMEKDKGKYLIPCFKDIDAYDMPKEFARFQAQDMGKVGAIQDLLRGIEKLIGSREKNNQATQQVIVQQVSGGPNADALVKRGYDALEDGAFAEAKKLFDEVLNSNAESAEAYLGLFMAETKCKNKDSAKEKYVMGKYTDNRYWKRARQYAKDEIGNELEAWERAREDRLRKEEEERVRAQNEREEAERKRKEERNKKKEELKDIRAQIAEIKAGKYTPDAKDTEKLNGFKSKEEAAQKAWEQAKADLALMPQKAEITKLESEISKKRSTAASLGIFKGKEKKTLLEQAEVLEDTLKSKRREVESRTKEVDQLQKDYLTAQREAYQFVGEILDKAIGVLQTQEHSLWLEVVGECVVGATVRFGGDETGPIEWRVLDRVGNKALLLSEYRIKSLPYDKGNTDATWETCSLRKWLNETFLNTAFDSDEIGLIQSTIVTADKNPYYNTSPGNNTTDKVFLLSISEVNKYFKSASERRLKRKKSEGFEVLWWLRSPGADGRCAAAVNEKGSIEYNGNFTFADFSIRPAIWINLEP